MKLTLISHFFNEEFLLPYWLDHHRRIFDHGILIDYQSTDKSIEIIKKIVPTWEIRPSRNKTFDCFAVDNEVMDVERTVPGWKMVLNTTEFLVYHDMKKLLKEIQPTFPGMGFRAAGVIMADHKIEPLDSSPLIFQRHHGWHEAVGARNRMIHDHPDGRYSVGRHSTHIPSIIVHEMFLCWFGWSPWPYVKERKLQIQTRIPHYHIGSLFGAMHQIDGKTMEDCFLANSKVAKNLKDHVGFSKELELVKTHLYGG